MGMAKVGRNDPCPCGSGKKFKKCCLDKKPRERIIMVGSSEPLRGLQFDKDKMEFKGITHDGRLIATEVTFSQTQYTGQSGKEKVIIRVNDKVIPDEADLLRYLSSFGLIIAVDTNTKLIKGETISVTGVVHCVVQPDPDQNSYFANFPWHGAILFRNCPKVLPPEKFGWLALMREFNRDPLNRTKKVAIVTDHDMDHHLSYNSKKLPIYRDILLPENMTIIYGRGDGSIYTILNYLVVQCDKKAKEILEQFETSGFYELGDKKIPLNKIPVPGH